MSKEVEFERLRIKRQRTRIKEGKMRPSVAFDTETEDGYVRLVCSSEGEYLWVEDPEDLMRFLARRKYEGKLLWFWNLKYDAEAIIKTLRLSPDEMRRLLRGEEVEWKGWRMRYLARRCLKISRGHRTWTFYDLCQFYGHRKLSEAAKEIGEEKIEFPMDELAEHLGRRSDEVLRYCLKDAEIAGKLADRLVLALFSLGFRPKTYTSFAAIAADHLRQSGARWRPVQGHPSWALEFAYRSYRGGWIEAIRRGRMEKVYQVDLNSAYAWAISTLPSMLRGCWVRDRGEPSPDFDGVAFCRCEVTMSSWLHSFAYKPVKGGVNLYPLGSWETYLTWDEVRFIREHNLGEVEVKEYVAFMDLKPEYPFRKWVEELYGKRKALEKRGCEFEAKIIKQVLASLYGKFIERNKHGEEWETGPLFNPIYASLVTARVRLKVLEAALKVAKDVVMVATDSLFVKSLPDLQYGDGLGEWRVKDEGEILVLGAGMFTLRGRDGKTTKKRGFPSDVDFFELCSRDPDAREIRIVQESPYPLAFALRDGEPEKACRFERREIRLPLNFDRKRTWCRDVKRLSELLEREIPALPWTVLGGKVFAPRFHKSLFEKDLTNDGKCVKFEKEKEVGA
ncbi:hypothetical protein J7L60_01870 [Candidatus Bathyarchaeota archaeon]|nr:hypothetical protein [Candidatus Bathyarchaeota archaeon]